MKSNTAAVRPVLTKIAGKYQITIPPSFRKLFDLQEGDLFEWSFEEKSSAIKLTPKRAQLITPRIKELMDQVEKEEQDSDQTTAEYKGPVAKNAKKYA